MIPREVARSYDEIADRWDDEGFPSDNGIEAHRRAIAFVERKRHALDVGCGCSGRIIDLLLEHGFDVEGLDLSERMLELARRRHPAVTFHHADICAWNPTRDYDLISGWDSTWHVPLAEQETVLRKILGALAPGGVYIFTTGGLDGPSETVNSDMGPRMYYAVLGIPGTLEVLAECGCVCRHLEYDQHPELHVYLVAQKAGDPSGA